MTNRSVRSLSLLAVMMGLSQVQVQSAEPLPPRALARIGDHRFYHGPGINCAVLSPDGKRIASAAQDSESDEDIARDRNDYNRTLVLWDAVTGELLREMRVPQGTISSLAFSLDGKRLAASYRISDEKSGVVLFDVESGELVRRLGEFPTDTAFLRYSADGKQLWVSEWGGSVSAWDAATGKQLRRWKPPPSIPYKKGRIGKSAVQGVMSPDGRLIAWEMSGYAVGSCGSVWMEGLRIHDAAANKLLYEKKFRDPDQESDHDGLMWSFAFTCDGKRLVADCDKFVVWEAATGKERTTFKAPGMVRFTLAPDGRRAVIEEAARRGKKSRLRLWDIESGKPLRQLSSAFEDLECGCRKMLPVFSADGKTLLLATDSTLRLFDVESAEECSPPRHRAPIVPRFSADGRTLFTSCEEGRCRWNVSGKEPILLGNEKTGKVSGMIEKGEPSEGHVLSPDGRFVAWVDRIGTIHLHEAASMKKMRTLPFSPPLPKADGISLCLRTFFSPDGERLIVTGHLIAHSDSGADEMIGLPLRVFHVSSGREIARFYANPKKTNKANDLSCTAWTADGRLLAVAEKYSGTIRLLEIASGKVRAEFTGHRHGVHGLDFSPDGKTLASGGEDNVVYLWDVTDAKTTPAKEENLSSWWDDLASEDAKRAGESIGAFLRKPEASVAFLQEKLHPAKGVDQKHLKLLIADLDADLYSTRESASRELIRLGERAEDALRRELTNRPTLEVRRRIEDVLSRLEPSPPPPETLRILRAIEVLEHIGTPVARRCLEVMSKGASEAKETHEASAALRRLDRHRPDKR